jgi:hypothetical protein
MQYSVLKHSILKHARSARAATLSVALLCAAQYGLAQDTPLLSGGVGFFTSTPGGQTTYSPIIQPLLAAPIGKHFFVESRAFFTEDFTPKGSGVPGYDHMHFIGLTYLQGAYIASPHLTIVGGSFLLPFNTYNERLSPIWIGNFQSGPLIQSLGLMNTGVGTGGMVRGSAFSRRKISGDYAAYFSSRDDNQYWEAKRSAGGRGSLYFPDQRLEVGISYSHLLQGVHENFYGGHLWWEPKDTGFQLRSEYSRGHHADGYWFETDYRTKAFGGFDSFIGRFEPTFRMNQSFRRDKVSSDGVPSVNTQQVDFGLDYNLPHNTRILTSYSREFSSKGNVNIWQTGIVYRFLVPAWKGK